MHFQNNYQAVAFDNGKPIVTFVALRTDKPRKEKDQHGYYVTQSSGGMTVTFNGLKKPEFLAENNAIIFGVQPVDDDSIPDGATHIEVDDRGIVNVLTKVDAKIFNKAYAYVNQEGAWWANHHMPHKISHVDGGAEAYMYLNDVVGKAVANTIKFNELGKDKKPHQVIFHDSPVAAATRSFKECGTSAIVGYFAHTTLANSDVLDQIQASGVTDPNVIQACFVHPLYVGCDKVMVHTTSAASDLASMGVHQVDEKFIKVGEAIAIQAYIDNVMFEVPVTVVPAGPDLQEVRDLAEQFKDHPDVKKFEEEYAVNDQTTFIISGRYDEIKNHDGAFDGIEDLLERNPEALRHARFVMIGQDTRKGLTEYDEYALKIRAQLARINDKAIEKGIVTVENPLIKEWGPVPREVLMGIYGKSKAIAQKGGKIVNMVHSRRDGMNFVALEGAAFPDVLSMVPMTAGASRSLGHGNVILSCLTHETDKPQARTKETSENIERAINTPVSRVHEMHHNAMMVYGQFPGDQWTDGLLTATDRRAYSNELNWNAPPKKLNIN